MLELALQDLRRFERLFRLMVTEGERVPELGRVITTALQRHDGQLQGEGDPLLAVTLSALWGYHMFSIMQGRPFQGVTEDEFIAALAALTPKS